MSSVRGALAEEEEEVDEVERCERGDDALLLVGDEVKGMAIERAREARGLRELVSGNGKERPTAARQALRQPDRRGDPAGRGCDAGDRRGLLGGFRLRRWAQ